MLTSEDKFVSFWGPKIGQEAALRQWRSFVLLLYLWGLGMPGVVLLTIGAQHNLPVLLLVGIVLLCAGVACGIVSCAELVRSHNLAGKLLGLKLGVGHVAPPPRTREHYEAWCKKYGITPYAAMSGEERSPGDQPAGRPSDR